MTQNNEENKDHKKRDTLDKIFMGAVIGGAIGSVIGASIAPKKGKETRQEIVEAVKNTGKTSKKILHKIKDFFSFKKKKEEAQKAAGTETRQRSSIKKIPNEEGVEIEK